MLTTNRQNNETDSAIHAAFKVLQFAKAKKREAEFQFDVAVSELRAAEKEVLDAQEAFAEASDALFARQQAGIKEAA